MMKKILILLLFLCKYSFSQTPGWQWAQNFGSTGSDFYNGSCTDGSWIYMTGKFSSPTVTFGTTVLTNVGGSDIYLVKFDFSGNVVWAKSVGGTGDDEGDKIMLDHNGNLLVSGTFSNTVSFGTSSLTSAGSLDIFIAKFDTAGNALSAKKAGGVAAEWVYGMGIDAEGSIYLDGHFVGTVATFGSTNLVNAAQYYSDVYIAKFDSSGNSLWAKRAGGTSTDNADDLAVDADGNCYMAGFFSSSTITFGSTVLTSTGYSDIFVVRYDKYGNVIWTRQYGGIKRDYGWCIAMDENRNCYVSGGFQSPAIDFGNGPLANVDTSALDMYIVKLDSSGNSIWSRRLGDIGDDEAFHINLDNHNSVYLSGTYESAFSFGSSNLNNSVGGDIILAKYDSTGNEVWALTAGGIYYEGSGQTIFDNAGNCYMAGSFQSPSMAFGSITLYTAGAFDIYLAKVGDVTSIEEYFNRNFIVYPNPAHNILNVECRMQNAELKMYDMTGRIVLEESLHSQLSTFNFQLAAGIYLVRVEAGERVWQEKVVVE